MFKTIDQMIDYLNKNTEHVDYHHRTFTGDFGTKLKFLVVYIPLDQEDFAKLLMACIDWSLRALLNKDQYCITIRIPE